MQIDLSPLATWPTDVESATKLQNELRAKVVVADRFDKLKTVAGVDVSYDIASNLTRAFIVLMKLDDLKPLKSVTFEAPTVFPYIPGFLSFREVPAILQALGKLDDAPDLLMVDGQGIAHPRRFGIAAHLGVLTGLPAIGVAKSRLVGRHSTLADTKGAQVPLLDRSEQIGTVYRSKDGCNPLFISPGHRVAQEMAVQLVERCLTRYRLPEPTRLADKLSKEKPAAHRHIVVMSKDKRYEAKI